MFCYSFHPAGLALPSKYKTPRSTVSIDCDPFSAVRSLRVSFPLVSCTIFLLISVSPCQGASNPQSDFEHELEIELSSAEVRRQGDLALLGDPKNQYEELVKGFIDNIRVLARAVPSH
jgi:hypothetical protein